MLNVAIALTALSLAIWLFLLLFWGDFWRCDQRLDEHSPPASLDQYPAIAVVIPARDEAAVIERSLRSLLNQTYPGPLSLILVDDQSSDGTGAIAQGLATAYRSVSKTVQGDRSLTVLAGQPLPSGWSGKLWAIQQGIAQTRDQTRDQTRGLDSANMPPEYVLLTDADIEHAPQTLERLVAKAELEALDLASLMVKLRCESSWERLLIPAFIFFFQKLYPFPWVNQRQKQTAAAAGGCILLRLSRLEAIGGIEAVRDALIDDCALARAVKGQGGRIWLGLSLSTLSLRPYPDLASIWKMVARTAYTQLYYSPLLLLGTLVGMVLVYGVAPLAVVGGAIAQDFLLLLLGLLTWGLMAIAYWPTLKMYQQPFALSFALPTIALLYNLMTLDSARRHWQGAGGTWKGRSYSR